MLLPLALETNNQFFPTLFITTDKYDWMSPRSPLRQKNDEFYYEFKRIESYIAEAQLNATATGKHPCLVHECRFFLFLLIK